MIDRKVTNAAGESVATTESIVCVTQPLQRGFCRVHSRNSAAECRHSRGGGNPDSATHVAPESTRSGARRPHRARLDSRLRGSDGIDAKRNILTTPAIIRACTRFCLAVLVAVTSACPSIALAQFADPGTTAATTVLSSHATAAVDAAIERQMREDETVGLAVGIIRDAEIVYLKGYGHADRDAATPVTTGTMFRWASISKPVCAIAALQLAEQGKLDLDADVRDYVPEFPDPGATITSRQLLCHQGGIVHYSNGEVVGTPRKYEDPFPFRDVVAALDTFNRSPLVNRPGEKYSYTTHGFILLSAVVQRAGGQPFHEQVSERICRPLGLDTLQPDYQWNDIPQRTRGYRRVKQRIVDSVDDDVSWKLGGGGYISSIEDLCRFAQALIEGKLVSERTEAAMWTPQPTSGGEATAYGLGFRVEEQSGRLKVSHNGSQHKTRTRMVFYPAQRHGVVVMTNSEWVKPDVYTTLTYKALAGERSPAPAQ